MPDPSGSPAPGRRVRVMYVVHSLEVGGLEKCVVDLVNGLDRDRFEPMVCCLTRNGPSGEKIHDPQTRIFEMEKRGGNDPLVPLRLAGLFRREQIDVVHSGNWGTQLESFVGAKLARVPRLVHMEQGMELDDLERVPKWKRRLRGLVKYGCALGTVKVVTVSKDLKEFVHRTTGIGRRRIQVIYNSVDTARFVRAGEVRKSLRHELGAGEGEVLIGSVGRLAEVKNYRCLVDAMAEVCRRCARARLVVVGDGPQREMLEARIRELKLEDRVTLLGQRSDVPDVLSALDLYVLPSIFEGISISILEAMAAGLPIVATRVGGNPEIVVDGETGLLAESRNALDLAEKLVLLIDDATKRRNQAVGSRDRVNRMFHAKSMVAKYEALYSGEGRGRG